jgi:hypothetical protein
MRSVEYRYSIIMLEIMKVEKSERISLSYPSIDGLDDGSVADKKVLLVVTLAI